MYDVGQQTPLPVEGLDPMDDASTFYTLPQVAQLLGVHYETVARWVRSGKLGGVKLSRRKVIVPKTKLDAFLGSARRDAAPEPEAGLPHRWLALVGTLHPKEAERLRRSTRDLETLDREEG